MNNDLRRAMHDSDHYVIEMDYKDSKGIRTRRTVSPIRFVGKDRVLAMCLCREQPRQFYLDRCENIRLIPADEVLMPMPIATPIVFSPAPTAFPAVPATEAMLCGV